MLKQSKAASLHCDQSICVLHTMLWKIATVSSTAIITSSELLTWRHPIFRKEKIRTPPMIING